MEKRAMSPSGSSSSGPRGRKRSNVTRACLNCRERKKKCDGVRPACKACQQYETTLSYQEECVWDGRVDYRKPVSKEHVTQLRLRVAELEQQLQTYQEQSSETSTAAVAPETHQPQPEYPDLNLGFADASMAVELPSRPVLATRPMEIRTNGQKRGSRDQDGMPDTLAGLSGGGAGASSMCNVDSILVQGGDGGLQFHGPTSAYHHAALQHRSPHTSSGTPKSSFAFDRFLPDFPLTRSQHDQAVDRFFRYFACWAQRVTPHWFHRDMARALVLDDVNEIQTRTPHYSPMLHNLILSIGLGYSDEAHLEARSTRRIFMEHARKRFDVECASPSLATVQALTLLASYHSMIGEYALGWQLHGLSLRASHAMGLNIDTSSLVQRGLISQETFTMRGVTFWSCFCQEEMWAVYIGRDPLVQSHTTPPPEVDADTDNIMWHWPTDHAYENSVVPPPQPSYLSMTFVQTVRIMKIATNVTRSVYALRREKDSPVDMATIQGFRQELEAWLDGLPRPLLIAPASSDPVLPHVMMIHLAWSWVVILLFRPFSRLTGPSSDSQNSSFEDISGHTCMTKSYEAAIKILRIATLWETQHNLRFVPPTMAQIVYTAGSTFLLAAAQAKSSHQSAVTLEKARMCLHALNQIGQTWPAGTQKATILSDLIAEYGHSSYDGASADLTAPAGHGGEGVSSVYLGVSSAYQPNGAQNDFNGTQQVLPTADLTSKSSSSFQPNYGWPSQGEVAMLSDGFQLNENDYIAPQWSGETTSDSVIDNLLQQISMPTNGEIDFMTLLQIPNDL